MIHRWHIFRLTLQTVSWAAAQILFQFLFTSAGQLAVSLLLHVSFKKYLLIWTVYTPNLGLTLCVSLLPGITTHYPVVMVDPKLCPLLLQGKRTKVFNWNLKTPLWPAFKEKKKVKIGNSVCLSLPLLSPSQDLPTFLHSPEPSSSWCLYFVRSI